MAFDPSAGEEITLEDAAAMTAEYRSQNPGAVKAHYLNKTLIASILNQTGAAGIRIYRGIDTEGNHQVVIVGVKSDGTDMTSGIIADRADICPPNCNDQSSLNG